MDNSCEIPREVLDSPISETETCEQTDSLTTSSKSTSKAMAIMSPESKPIIKSKVVLRKDLHLPPTADNILYEAKTSLIASLEQLLAEQEKCVDKIERIEEVLKILSNYPDISTTSKKELLDTLKSPTEFNALIHAEKNINSFILEIKNALRAIIDKLTLPLLADKVLYDALTSLRSSMKRIIIPTQTENKILIIQIKKALAKAIRHASSADEDVVYGFQSLNESIRFILAEQNPQDMYFSNIEELLKLIV